MPVSIVVPAGGGSNPFGDTVDLSEMQQIATARLIGNISGGNAVPSALTQANVFSFLGSGTPGSGNYLRGDGSWQSISGGKIAQVVSTFGSAVQTGTTVTPMDDSIPQQSSEGTEFYTRSITPTNASSTLLFLIQLYHANSVGYTTVAHVHVDSTADAIWAGADSGYSSAGYASCLSGLFAIPAGSTNARTYKLKAGPATASTLTINGTGGSRRLGGVMSSGLVILEVGP